MGVANWLTYLVLAQAEGEAAPEGLQGFLQGGFVPILLMIGAMYFIMIRPMMKQNREHADMLKGLKKDDEVVTSGGIIGKIYAMDDTIVNLEIASGVRIKVLRTNIAGPAKRDANKAATVPAKE